jgi:tRNA modification GTPase
MTQTLAARLTPPGSGAIATIEIRGPSAWEIARGLFRRRSAAAAPLPESPRRGDLWLGRFGADASDDVVLAASHDGCVPTVQVHCHGGREVVDLLLGAIRQRGARVCDLAEYYQARVPFDRWRVLAEQRLLLAPSVRTAAILLQQCSGRFGMHLRLILAAFDGNAEAGAILLRALVQNVPVGRHLTEPWRVTVAGAPNVGKSSLVNALAGYQRCIVSPTPGTTRDVVPTTVALDGWPVELADTAGIREAPGALEEQGIERARSASAAADLCLWVLDASAAPVWPDLPPERVLLIVNKIDLSPTWDVARAAGALHVSACTGTGVPDLCDAVVRRLVPQAPEPTEAVPFTPELCDAVEEAHTHAVAGRCDEVRRMLTAIIGC